MADTKRAAFSRGNAALSVGPGDDRCLLWSKFFLWLNWCAIRCRRWRAAGIAAACSAPRAAGSVARSPPGHDPEKACPKARQRACPGARTRWVDAGFRLERDDFRMNHHRALTYYLSMIFSENRYPPIGSEPEGMLFRIMLYLTNAERLRGGHAQPVR